MAKLKLHENDGNQAPNARVGLTEGKAQMTVGGFPAQPGVFIQIKDDYPLRVTATDNIWVSVEELKSEVLFTLEPHVLLDQIWYLAAPGSTAEIRQDFANLIRTRYKLPA